MLPHDRASRSWPDRVQQQQQQLTQWHCCGYCSTSVRRRGEDWVGSFPTFVWIANELIQCAHGVWDDMSDDGVCMEQVSAGSDDCARCRHPIASH